MGSETSKIDARSKFSFGYMIVQLDKPYYTPGDGISGNVYFRVSTPMNATDCHLTIKGKEKSSFT